MTEQAIIALVGGVFLLVAVMGQVKIYIAEIPSSPIGMGARIASGIIGLSLIGVSLWLAFHSAGILVNNNTSTAGISSAPSETQSITPDTEDNAVAESTMPPSPTNPSSSERVIINTPSSPTSAPTVQIAPTQEQFSSAIPTQQPVISFCPVYEQTGIGTTQIMDILVDYGQIAFINAFSFDNRSGGVFIKITGYYSARHTVHDGAFCGGIPADADYAPIEQKRRDSQDVRTWDIELP
jgi:hypothetical protein